MNEPIEQKWPWTITDREFGALEQELKEIRHDLRNLKMIVDESGVSAVTKDEIIELRDNLSKTASHISAARIAEVVQKNVNEDLVKLKIKVYTAFSVIGIMAAILVWLVDVAMRLMN